MSKVVHVNVSPAPYDVLVGDGILGSLGQQLKSHFPAALKAAVIYDQTVRPHLEPAITAAVASAGLGLVTSQIDSGEENKHLATLLPVYTDLLSARIDRDTPVVGVGGGVLTDMAGFVAATILRGIALVQVPTTLLSMVDASVGGKTGINHAVGKNLIGAFHQPSLVLIDVQTLKTLPRDQISQGLAECIKHAAIRDAAHFADLEQNITRALNHDLPYLVDLVAHNVAIKARVVEQDPREKGIRAHLNFGHTFGHAIETVSNHAYPHGQAIAIGMTAASYLSVKLGLLSDADRTRLVSLLKKAELPTTCTGLAASDLIQTMAFDKKAKSGHVRHVLLSSLGEACLRHDIPEALVREALAVIGSH